VRLLIDEMYPPVIAERLREVGHDAVCVVERSELVGQDDREVWRFAATQRRAIVTENAADFLAISKEASSSGHASPSLVITSNRSFPRHPRSFIGRALRAFGAFCDAHPDDDPQAGAVYWLRPVP
jgi:predicted nuclease of predicted toxin-antitoxin system